MSRRLEAALLVACLLACAALRATHLDGMSIWQDEGLSLYRAGMDLDGILGGEIPLGDLVTTDVHPPLYFLLLGGWFRLVGHGTWTGKWFSLLAGLPTVALVWALGRRTVGRRAALLAAALAALSPLYLWYSQEIRSYTLIVTLGLASVYAIARATGTAGPVRARLAWAAGSVGAVAALLWAHYLGFTLLPVLLAAAMQRAPATLARAPRIRRGALLAGAALAIGLAALAAPLLPFAAHRLGLGAERDQRYVAFRVIALDVLRGFGFGRTLYAADLSEQGLLAVRALMAALAVLLVVGALGIWRRSRRSSALVTSYLALPVLGVWLVTLVKPIYLGAYHLILASPPFHLLCAAGLAAVWHAADGRRPPTARRAARLAALALGACVVGPAIRADANLLFDPRFRKDELRALAHYVDEHAVPGDVLVVSHPVLEISFAQLSQRVPVLAVPRMLYDSTLDSRPPAEQLAHVLDGHHRVWFMTPAPEHDAWLSRHALQVDEQWFHGATIPVWLKAYEASPGQAPGPAVGRASGDATMRLPAGGAALRLGGLSLSAWRADIAPLVSGEAGRIGLWWRAEEDGLPDLKVALRLLDELGRDWADGDHAPFHGLSPTSGWPAGGEIYEPHDLSVRPGTPPGEYRLALELYDPTSGRSWPADGAAELGLVTVLRPAWPSGLPTSPSMRRLGAVAGVVDVLGIEVDAAERAPGEALTAWVWLRWRSDAHPGAALGLELLDRRLRVVRSAWLPLGQVPGAADGRLAAGDLVRSPIRIVLPAGGGRYGLRLRLADASGKPLWLRRGGLVARGLWAAELAVTASPRRTHLPAGARRLDVPVGPAVVLAGWRCERGGPKPGGCDEPLEGGDRLQPTLYWSSAGGIETAWHVTVQLLPASPAGDPAGPPVAQSDGPPAGGSRPATGWSPGEIVSDAHALDVPDDLSPGRYLLIAALYDPLRPDVPRPVARQDGRERDYVLLSELAAEGRGDAPAADGHR